MVSKTEEISSTTWNDPIKGQDTEYSTGNTVPHQQLLLGLGLSASQSLMRGGSCISSLLHIYFLGPQTKHTLLQEDFKRTANVMQSAILPGFHLGKITTCHLTTEVFSGSAYAGVTASKAKEEMQDERFHNNSWISKGTFFSKQEHFTPIQRQFALKTFCKMIFYPQWKGIQNKPPRSECHSFCKQILAIPKRGLRSPSHLVQ